MNGETNKVINTAVKSKPVFGDSLINSLIIVTKLHYELFALIKKFKINQVSNHLHQVK